MKRSEIGGARHVVEREPGAQVAPHQDDYFLHSHVQDERPFRQNARKVFAVSKLELAVSKPFSVSGVASSMGHAA